MSKNSPKYAWMNGKIIPWKDATVHVFSDVFKYGSNVFEGVRAYSSPNKNQLYLFRNNEHMTRLFNESMKILRMESPWNAEDITKGMIDLLRANDFHDDLHMRPTVYFGMGKAHAFHPDNIKTGCVITAIERPNKPKTLWEGINACVSSWRRIGDEMMPPRVKAGANYLNGRYAFMEARINGFHTPIILNEHGKVSEGPGACIMLVRKGQVVTPPVTAGILESVTRTTLMQLFRDEMSMEVVERDIDRTELYVSDEVFFCGTGAEILPVISIDNYAVGTGEPGTIVKTIQNIYFNIARGENHKYDEWLTPVY